MHKDSYSEQQVYDAIAHAITTVKYYMPDGPSKSQTYLKLQEALLWSESESILNSVEV